jgi:sigma-B regulation protein RsbU (phosphoserine phosphatase)
MKELLLGQIPLFRELSQTELEHLTNTLRVRKLAHETVLFKEGEVSDHFYIIIDGQMEIIKALGTTEERLIALRGPGEFIGELSLVNPDGLRMASVRSQGIAKLWEMTHADFDDLLHRHPKLSYKIVTVLSSRLTSAHDATIEDLKEKNRKLTEAYEELQAAQVQIIEKEILERELQMASEIQMSILPQEVPELQGFDFGVCFDPARAIGGDFFDFVPLDSETVGIFIGDVADKGVPSALFMAQIHALLYAEATRGVAPTEVLRRVNRILMRMNEKNLFATVIYGLLHSNTREFTYARAGHDLPIIGGKNGEAQMVPHGQGQLLGILEDPIFDEQTITIAPGSTLLLYTDGMTDCRNSKGEIFGIENLTTEIGALNETPTQNLCSNLLKTIKDYQGDAPQDDDITLVAIHSAETG